MTLASFLAVAVPALASGLAIALPILKATKWYKGQKEKKSIAALIIEGLSAHAVAETETGLVTQMKSANLQAGGTAKLTSTQGVVARNSAADIVQTIATKIDPRLSDLPIGDIISAIETAVQRYKAKLPTATQDRLAELRKQAQSKSGRALMGLLLAIAAVCGLCSAAPGCSALNAIPLDWENAAVADQIRVADAAEANIYAAGLPDDAMRRMLGSAGTVGAEAFLRVDPNRKTLDENAVAKAAVVAMTQYAETAYPALLNGSTLPAAIKEFLSVECTDTDALLGLMEAGIRRTAPPK